MSIDPVLAKFDAWLADAAAHPHIAEPTAMTLATADLHARPSARIVLLMVHDARGFVFYTNLTSRKGRELAENPQAALCFHWMPLQRQVRIEGAVEQVDDAEADAYFASRPRDSQLGAWASLQSQAMEDPDALRMRMAEMAARYAGRDVPRPAHWSGWRLVPKVVEFWQQGEFRLHDREVYRMADGGWRMTKLYP
jgi:pyridoxamine 5'-phosphate oxidase